MALTNVLEQGWNSSVGSKLEFMIDWGPSVLLDSLKFLENWWDLMKFFKHGYNKVWWNLKEMSTFGCGSWNKNHSSPKWLRVSYAWKSRRPSTMSVKELNEMDLKALALIQSSLSNEVLRDEEKGQRLY